MLRAVPLGDLNKAAINSPAAASPLLKKVQVNSESIKNFEEWMKIAADNKITSKNTWSASLIDYFSELSFFKSGNSINFQKASCTLDGCLKIYTSRVDSIVDETGRLLSGLSEQNENQLSVKENLKDEEKSTKKKTKACDTLERNLDNINIKSLDLDWSVDPLFKKTCADFDEGGARGLLMNNLGIDQMCQLRLDAANSSIGDLKAADDTMLLDLKYRCHFLRASQCEICPTFSNFDIKQPLSDLKILETDLRNLLSNQLQINALDQQSFDISDAEGESGADPATSQFDGFNIDENFNGSRQHESNSIKQDKRRESLMFSLKNSEETQFSYFDDSSMKNWAGPQHWKVRLHYKPQVKQDVKRAPKKINYIDFLLAEPVDPSQLFAKSNTPTTLSKTILEARLSQNNLFPEDLKYSTKNLLSFFTKPKWCFQLTSNGSLSIAQDNNSSQNNQTFALGTIASDNTLPMSQSNSQIDNFGESAEDEDGGFDEELQHAEQEDVEIGSNLVSEPKMTKILKMNYAKVGKRVDVKLLKDNMWKEIGAISSPLINFSDVISNLTRHYKPEQARELSVSYCFISLLHLANEKQLDITTSDGELRICSIK